MNSLIFHGKVRNISNRNKDSCWINLNLVDIRTESTSDFSHDFLPNTPIAALANLLSSPISPPEPTAHAATLDFNIIT